MEPLEWLIIGAAVVIGGLFGSKSKGMLKTAAKGYLVASEKAKSFSSNVRDDFKGVVEEARREQEQEEARNDRTDYEAEMPRSEDTDKGRTKANKATSSSE